MQPDPPVPLAFPTIVLGSADSRETAVDINVFHLTQGHSSELLPRETTNSLGIELLGDLTPCTGCSMAKGYRKPIASSSESRVPQQLGRGFMDLSSPKQTPAFLSKRHVVIVEDDFTRYAWVYFLTHTSGAANASKKFSADVSADGVPWNRL